MNYYIVLIKAWGFVLTICFLKAEGVKLVYDEVLPPDGGNNISAPIILLHGLATWRKDWLLIAPGLSKNTGRKVYALDTQNHGNSPWADDFNVFDMTEDLDEFLVDHNISKAILVGQSMGGRIAMVYALQKPEKVEKMVVEDMKPGHVSSKIIDRILTTITSLQTLFRSIHSTGDEQEDREFLQRFMQPLVKLEPCIDKGYLNVLPIRREGHSYAALANTKLLLEKFTEENINTGIAGVFNGSALFIYGRKSFMELEKDETIPKYFPRARLVGFDTGHCIHQHFPEEFTEEVSNFINDKETH